MVELEKIIVELITKHGKGAVTKLSKLLIARYGKIQGLYFKIYPKVCEDGKIYMDGLVGTPKGLKEEVIPKITDETTKALFDRTLSSMVVQVFPFVSAREVKKYCMDIQFLCDFFQCCSDRLDSQSSEEVEAACERILATLTIMIDTAIIMKRPLLELVGDPTLLSWLKPLEQMHHDLILAKRNFINKEFKNSRKRVQNIRKLSLQLDRKCEKVMGEAPSDLVQTYIYMMKYLPRVKHLIKPSEAMELATEIF